MEYQHSNIDFVKMTLAEHTPPVWLIEPEGTYLAWLAFTGLEMNAKTLATFLAQDAELALSPGHWFGREGAGYARMNIAYSRDVLQQAFSRLSSAVRRLDLV